MGRFICVSLNINSYFDCCHVKVWLRCTHSSTELEQLLRRGDILRVALELMAKKEVAGVALDITAEEVERKIFQILYF